VNFYKAEFINIYLLKMLRRKPFLCGQLNANWDGYPIPQHLLGLQNAHKKFFWYSGQKVNEKYGKPIENNGKCWKAHNGRSDHIREHSTQSLSGETAATLGMKTKRMLLQRDGKLKHVNRPKVIQKVSAFGPAHAEYARELFHSKDTQSSNGYGDYFVQPFHPSLQDGRHTLISNREPVRTTKNYMSQGPIRDVHWAQYRKPIFKVARITPRSDGRTVNKSRSAEGYAKEGVEGKNSFCSMEEVSKNEACPTIFQLLCEISDHIQS